MTDMRIMLRRAMVASVFLLPLLVVVYAVVMGAAALLVSLGDHAGGLALRWIGTIVAILFAADCIVLLLLLAWDRLDRDEELE
jgi:hypothetical protein